MTGGSGFVAVAPVSTNQFKYKCNL